MIEYTFDLYFVCPRRHLSSDHLPLAFYLWDFELNSLTIVHSFLDQSMSSDKVQGPIYNFGPLPLQKLYLLINFVINVFLYFQYRLVFNIHSWHNNI